MGTHAAYCEDVLILYDSSGQHGHVGSTHAVLLENLLGHFNVSVAHKPVSAYQSGEMGTALATFYIGAIFNEASNYAPESDESANYNHFLNDASQTTAPLVWFNYNLWWLADYLQQDGRSLTDMFGFSANGVLNNGYNRVSYKDTELFKGVVPHANPGANLLGCSDEGEGRWACATELAAIEIVDPAKVKVYAETYSTITPTVDKKPYISRSGNFWFVGDLPTTHFSEEDRYLVLADVLHDILGIEHEEAHRALVRLEDVSAKTTEEDFMEIAEYLQSASIPFAVSVIPVHVETTGARHKFSQSPVGRYLSGMINGPWRNRPYAYIYGNHMADISIVAHGYTHQCDYPQNPYDGESGSDFEFYRVTANDDNSLNFLGPLPGDVGDWAYRRMVEADNELKSGGLPAFAWSAPHYIASARAYAGIQALYPIHYGRVTYFIERDNWVEMLGQFFPYPVHKDAYGYQIVPENIGYYESEPIPGYRPLYPEDMIRHARANLVVRDGYASFFYHPPKGVTHLRQVVEGIQALGYEFVAPKSIFPSTQPADTNESQVAQSSGEDNGCFLSLLMF